MKNPSSASGQGVARASPDSMTASATNSYTRIIAHSHVKVVGSHLRGLMPSTGIVRYRLQHTSDIFDLIQTFIVIAVRSEGGSGCLKAQELNPDNQGSPGSLKVEPDAGGPQDWRNSYSSGAVLM